MRPNISSTSQYISYFARHQPDAVAVIKGSTSVSYQMLATQLVQVTKALQELSIQRGTLVGIECSDRLLHLLLILACEIIGAPSVSFGRTELSPNNHVVRLCGFIFLGAPQDNLSGQRTLVITPAWKNSVFSKPVQTEDLACLDTEPDLEQVVRINRTSGSTGRPKVMENSHRTQKIWIEKGISIIKNKTFTPQKFFILYNFSIRSVHLRVRMALHIGGTVVFTDAANFFRDCERFDEIYVHLVIFDVQKLVSDVPPNFRRPSVCYLQASGGMLPPVLRAKAKQAFASEVDVTYGSNETTLISVIDENGVGTLLPGVDAVIVDEFDREKSYGDVGKIKLKVDGMVNGYFQDPELTAASFVDGWFRSGDIGYMPEPGKLVVLGRADDMLNIGGSKLSSHSIEERIRHVEGIGDIVIVSVVNKNGVGEIAAAIEIKQNGNRNHIKGQLQKIFPSHLGPIHVMFTGALPRTESGKIRKQVVEARLRTAFGDESARQA